MLIDKETKDALVKENIPTIMGGGCPEWTSLKKKECPFCKSKNLSKVGHDFIYSITEAREIPIQFCNDCYAEWFIEVWKMKPSNKKLLRCGK